MSQTTVSTREERTPKFVKVSSRQTRRQMEEEIAASLEAEHALFENPNAEETQEEMLMTDAVPAVVSIADVLDDDQAARLRALLSEGMPAQATEGTAESAETKVLPATNDEPAVEAMPEVLPASAPETTDTMVEALPAQIEEPTVQVPAAVPPAIEPEVTDVVDKETAPVSETEAVSTVEIVREHELSISYSQGTTSEGPCQVELPVAPLAEVITLDGIAQRLAAKATDQLLAARGRERSWQAELKALSGYRVAERLKIEQQIGAQIDSLMAEVHDVERALKSLETRRRQEESDARLLCEGDELQDLLAQIHVAASGEQLGLEQRKAKLNEDIAVFRALGDSQLQDLHARQIEKETDLRRQMDGVRQSVGEIQKRFPGAVKAAQLELDKETNLKALNAALAARDVAGADARLTKLKAVVPTAQFDAMQASVTALRRVVDLEKLFADALSLAEDVNGRHALYDAIAKAERLGASEAQIAVLNEYLDKAKQAHDARFGKACNKVFPMTEADKGIFPAVTDGHADVWQAQLKGEQYDPNKRYQWNLVKRFGWMNSQWTEVPVGHVTKNSLPDGMAIAKPYMRYVRAWNARQVQA
jgi:hypothetical protein